MNALFHQYSSQKQVFRVLGSSVDYDPSTMVVTDWHEAIKLLWAALKSFLTFAQQQEHNLINDKFKVPRLKPWLPKDKKPVAAAVKEKYPKVSPPALKAAPKEKPPAKPAVVKKGRKVERKVEFEDNVNVMRLCIQDMAKHYKIPTSLTPCQPDCQYVHYNKLPINLSANAVLSTVDKVLTKLGFTEHQLKQFEKSIRADPKFK